METDRIRLEKKINSYMNPKLGDEVYEKKDTAANQKIR
jgi:hypothetical protein